MSDLDRMPYCDWVIHKKLLGINLQRVYIYPSCGNGKAYRQLELYKELFTDGKDVRFVTKKNIPEPRVDFKTIKDVIRDLDLLPRERYEEIGRYIHEHLRQRIDEDLKRVLTSAWVLDNWRPVVRHDAYIFSTVPLIGLNMFDLYDKEAE